VVGITRRGIDIKKGDRESSSAVPGAVDHAFLMEGGWHQALGVQSMSKTTGGDGGLLDDRFAPGKLGRWRACGRSVLQGARWRSRAPAPPQGLIYAKLFHIA
jgi:hypothetical protein